MALIDHIEQSGKGSSWINSAFLIYGEPWVTRFVLAALWGCAADCAHEPQPPSIHNDSEYQIWDKVLIPMRDGGMVSAIVVKKMGSTARLPTLLTVDIYADPASEIARAKDAADNDYVGVFADSRSKSLSRDPIVPYEHDASDGYDIIDWITKQTWSFLALCFARVTNHNDSELCSRSAFGCAG